MSNLYSRNSTRSRSTPTPCCSKVGIKRGPWTPEEDELLANYIKNDGEGRWRTLPKRAGLLRWSLIAGRIPGRTDNEIKNYWNTHLRKKLISQGIDPRTHKPLYPNPNSSEIANIAPTQNSNPNSFPLEENARVDRATATRVIESLTITNSDQFPNLVFDDGAKTWPNCDGFNKGLQSHHEQNKEDDYIGNENEDTFSLFLDSLINENAFHHGSIWEAEVTSSMVAFGEKDGALNSYDLA
ncbi:hypothetical protein NC651_030129 [Populus alba x Populus x berolinensis]|nr:hypothetical protein NC651_030129 [Populus alba x Populus x berolinensis]